MLPVSFILICSALFQGPLLDSATIFSAVTCSLLLVTSKANFSHYHAHSQQNKFCLFSKFMLACNVLISMCHKKTDNLQVDILLFSMYTPGTFTKISCSFRCNWCKQFAILRSIQCVQRCILRLMYCQQSTGLEGFADQQKRDWTRELRWEQQRRRKVRKSRWNPVESTEMGTAGKGWHH